MCLEPFIYYGYHVQTHNVKSMYFPSEHFPLNSVFTFHNKKGITPYDY